MKNSTGKTIYIISLVIQGLFYTSAGINHFIHPGYYISIMPGYFPVKETLNLLAGVAEIILGLGLFFKPTRKWSAIFICLMLVVFIPVHLHPVLHPGNLVPLPLAIARLCIQPLLILWAWKSRK